MLHSTHGVLDANCKIITLCTMHPTFYLSDRSCISTFPKTVKSQIETLTLLLLSCCVVCLVVCLGLSNPGQKVFPPECRCICQQLFSFQCWQTVQKHHRSVLCLVSSPNTVLGAESKKFTSDHQTFCCMSQAVRLLSHAMKEASCWLEGWPDLNKMVMVVVTYAFY